MVQFKYKLKSVEEAADVWKIRKISPKWVVEQGLGEMTARKGGRAILGKALEEKWRGGWK